MTVDWSAGGGHVTAGGASLEWACFGPPPGVRPVLVLLHEGLGCLALWRDFPARLAAATGCSVFAYSRAGYGQSDPCALPRPLDYMTDEAVTVLPAVLAAIGGPRHVLFGHSDGATIAAIYAGRIADPRLGGLILMAPHFFVEETGLEAIRAAKAAYRGGEWRRRAVKYHAAPDVAFRGWNDAWLDPAFTLRDAADALSQLSVPALAIQGHDDQYGSLAQIEIVAQRSPAPVRLAALEDCRHAPQFEAPDATLAAVSAFIRDLDGADLGLP